MKKILLILLLLLLIPLSACGRVKYEFKDGIMYENGKEASGTFELTIYGFKSKGKFINGLADGLLEIYYPDGSYLKDKRMDIFYDDGQLVMSFNLQTGESSSYHENGNPLFVMTRTKSTLYNENNEALFEVKNGESINIGTTLKELEDGTFEILKNNKIIAKIDDKDETLTYLYSTGEKLMTTSSVSGDTEIFFNNGQTFIKVNGVNSRFYYKDGKLLYESNNGEWKFFDRDGKQIMSNFDNITDVKKLN